MPLRINYPGYSSEAEYRAAFADQIAAEAAYAAANDSRFDATVRRLAPIIRQLCEDPERRSTRKLADRLNTMRQLGPNGRKFTPPPMGTSWPASARPRVARRCHQTCSTLQRKRTFLRD